MYTFIHLLNNVTSTSYGSKQHRSMVLGPVTTWSGAASGDNRLPVYTLQTNCYFRYSAMVAFDQVWQQKSISITAQRRTYWIQVEIVQVFRW